MFTRFALPASRFMAAGACAVLASLVVVPVAGAQQSLSPVEIEAARVETENARADKLEAYALTLYSTPSKFREVAELHQRAAMIRGDDPRAVDSYRSAAWAYSAAKNSGLATQMMVKAADHAAQVGRIEEAANAYLDAALLALADKREDRVLAMLARMHTVVSAPLFPTDERTRIMERIRTDTRVAHLDPSRRAAP
ncbi:MAG TPA: hypothetical protein VK922_03535 [Gemmatimonadaceae bacterium]|nr:hypothetical protein [Gemmatimonadaceae bacterium]